MTKKWRSNFSQGSFFGSSPDNPGGLHLNFELIESADRFNRTRAITQVSNTFEGPPGHVHGGITSAILDEAMGNTCFKNQFYCLSANQMTNWLRPTPLNTTIIIEGWIEKVEGDKVYPHAHLTLEDGTVLVSAYGLYIHRPELFKKFAAALNNVEGKES